eukprot:CAMPEP_0167825276 /NCGR_PEP_ID=MMETSP0112_2-20121227/9274_1 /TAXON_ID=91324 /ORGANISM="Lotharella globosa, Strain CCCM811" /LENGTH=463 /DNA_ID=CAMNT_0007727361 /DNA_START=360 /DNA_END=1751 /DNA_ORIENTATION=+
MFALPLAALCFLGPAAALSKQRIGINNGDPPPVPRSEISAYYRRSNGTRTTMRDPRTGKVSEIPEVGAFGAGGMDMGAAEVDLGATAPDAEAPVIEIDYKSGGDGEVVIKSHELMLRHAPGVFGFASKCELDTAADHCAEGGLAAGDPFCTSGVIHTCRQLLGRCEEFETMPPCDKDRNECCKCSFQMCPLSREGCQRINRECYSDVGNSGSSSESRSSLSAETRRAVQRIFNMLDLNGDAVLDRGELAMLLSAFSSAHTTEWDRMSQHKYLTICSELGSASNKGVALSEAYKAFERRRGVLYNLMLRSVKFVKEGRQTQLEKHQASVQTIFALCDEDGDGVLSPKEFQKITKGKPVDEVRPGDRITVSRLKMLYLESHFRDLDVDLSALRSLAFGGGVPSYPASSSSSSSSFSFSSSHRHGAKEGEGGMVGTVTLLVILLMVLLGVIVALVFKLMDTRAKKE